MNLGLLVGGLITAFGCVEIALAMRSEDMPRWVIAQGAMFIQLGLAFLLMTVMPEGIMRTSMVSAFAVSALWFGVIQRRLMREDQQQPGAHS